MGLPSELLEQLKTENIFFVDYTQNIIIRMACDSLYKGLGETIGLLLFYLTHLGKLNGFIYKLSGRYRLTEKFNLSHWNFEKINFYKSGTSFSTRLYGFSSKYLLQFNLKLLIFIPSLLLNKSVEDLVYKAFNKSKAINILESLGIEGEIGVDKVKIVE